MGLLNEKVAIITGGSRGIGEGIVRKFVAEGASVVFTYRSSSEKADAIVAELGSDKVMAVQSDASKMEDAEALIKATVEKFERIDILINNAGITKDTLMLRMSEEHWDDVMDVNLKSVFVMTKSVLKTMMRQRAGSIIHMSSVVGVFGNAGQANYAASKSGIIGFSKSIAKEVGSRNIRSNVIAPGFIKTEMTGELDEKTKESYISSIPLKDFGKPDDIANGCVYLGSDMSRYVTGQVISICGGMNM
ncbi:MAG: 3-oxoacyl-[acyl-carrier-protein] reductase [Saprospiraceae bacterium]|nr:3-oxoacyl-[acyl-carrier-protein] reductase [Saprospiraceae bacterium]|tara:strand:+ start:2112 stop:2852 length:741 start_codon:yes stop_codon:yes gene_type:complete